VNQRRKPAVTFDFREVRHDITSSITKLDTAQGTDRNSSIRLVQTEPKSTT